MPKQKTHKGISKRMKVTGSGKVSRRKSNSGHLMSSKTSKTKRGLRKSTVVSGLKAKRIKVLLGE